MASARYWRVRAVAGGSNFSLSAIEFRAVAAGPDLTAPGGPVIVRSIFSATPSGGGYAAAYAVDDDPATFWASANGIAGQWIGYDFAGPVEIVEILMVARNDTAFSQAPTTCEVEYSDDNVTWTPIKRYSGLTWPASGASNTLTVPLEIAMGAARVGGLGLEVLHTGSPGAARVGGLGLEVLRSIADYVPPVGGRRRQQQVI